MVSLAGHRLHRPSNSSEASFKQCLTDVGCRLRRCAGLAAARNHIFIIHTRLGDSETSMMANQFG